MKSFFILMTAVLVPQFSYAGQNDRGIEILTIKKDIVLTPAVKFKYFSKGKVVTDFTSPSQMKTAYCAFENSKLENMTIKAKTVLDIKLKKMRFPNKNIIRYSLIESPTKNPQIFCDFTKFENFNEKKLRASVNRQFGAWARVTHQ